MQAFNFEDLMDDDGESDEEVEPLRQGCIAVNFDKDFKQKIRTVGESLDCQAGRLDCVDLEQGFFLTRLSLREDFENVLKKGPWFIGDHFLSLRPWEPNFKPAAAYILSIGTLSKRVRKGNAHEGVYSPWVIVARRKNGTKSHRSGGPSAENRNGFAFKSNGKGEASQRIRYHEREDRTDKPSGPPRESKRKLSPIRLVDKAQLERSIQRIGSRPTIDVQSVAGTNVSSTQLNNGSAMHERIGVELCKESPKSRNSSHCQRDTVVVSGVGDLCRGRSGSAEDDASELPRKPSSDCGLSQHQLQASNKTVTISQANNGI
nr:hypothetical protein CFP56_34547 [Quercus suber]